MSYDNNGNFMQDAHNKDIIKCVNFEKESLLEKMDFTINVLSFLKTALVGEDDKQDRIQQAINIILQSEKDIRLTI